MRKKLKPIVWVDGKYSYTYGYIDKKKLFTIGWKDGTYELGFEHLTLKKEFACNNDREVLKQKATEVLKYYINSFFEEK